MVTHRPHYGEVWHPGHRVVAVAGDDNLLLMGDYPAASLAALLALLAAA